MSINLQLFKISKEHFIKKSHLIKNLKFSEFNNNDKYFLIQRRNYSRKGTQKIPSNALEFMDTINIFRVNI